VPTNRRRRSHRRRDGVAKLDDDQRQELLTGRPFVAGAEFESDDLMREAWDLHREELLGECIERFPGRRPFAWWLFEGVPAYGERPVNSDTYADDAAQMIDSQRVRGILHTRIFPALQEDETEFLRRHDVLTAEELERLDGGDTGELW
jgi:hypothetical protein